MGGSGVNLNLKSNILSDISKISNNTSYTIKLPKTANNLRIINGAIFPSSESDFAHKVHKARLERDGIVIVEDASLLLLKIGTDIECSLTWGVAGQMESVKDGNLSDLEAVKGRYTVWRTENNFPKIDIGLKDDEKNMGMHPYLRFDEIFNWINEESGNLFDASGLLPKLGKLIFPLLQRKKSDNIEQNYMEMMHSSSSFIGIENQGGYISLSDHGYMYLPFTLSGSISDSVDLDTILEEKVYDSKLYGLWPKRGLEVRYTEFLYYIKGTFKVTGLLLDGKLDETLRFAILQSEYNGSGYLYIDYIDIPLERGDEYEAYYSVDAYVKASQGHGSTHYPELSLWTKVGTTRYYYTSGETKQANIKVEFTGRIKIFVGEYGADEDDTLRPYTGIGIQSSSNKYYYAPNLPNIKKIDFIKGICNIFGLYAYLDEDRIKFNGYETLYDNKPVAADWSDFLVYPDREQDFAREMEYSLEGIAQHNRFKWKNSDEYDGADGEIFVENETVDYETDLVKSAFAACRNRGDKAYIPVYSYNEKGELEYDSDDKGYVLTVDGSSNTAAFRSDWEALIQEYYQGYRRLISNSLVINEYFILNSYQVKNVRMDVPIYLRKYGCYFAIVEIKTKDKDLCDVKLLKL